MQAARSSAWYATVVQAQGRNADAIRWACSAIAEAEAVDDPDALGAGCFVMGWAYAALGKEGWEPLVQRSLAAYQRSGDRVKQAVILSNVGVVCQGEGRGDEAMDYYERGRDSSLKIGDVFSAAKDSQFNGPMPGIPDCSALVNAGFRLPVPKQLRILPLACAQRPDLVESGPKILRSLQRPPKRTQRAAAIAPHQVLR